MSVADDSRARASLDVRQHGWEGPQSAFDFLVRMRSIKPTPPFPYKFLQSFTTGLLYPNHTWRRYKELCIAYA